jgi:hypothetical protein
MRLRSRWFQEVGMAYMGIWEDEVRCISGRGRAFGCWVSHSMSIFALTFAVSEDAALSLLLLGLPGLFYDIQLLGTNVDMILCETDIDLLYSFSRYFS